VIPGIVRLVGATIQRIAADKGYRGHNVRPEYKFRIYISGRKRDDTLRIKRDLRRRAAVEAVIGHLNAEHRMVRNYLAHHNDDAANASLAAIGYNFSLIITWLGLLLSLWLHEAITSLIIQSA
jgi:IS5 family transposase